MLATDIANRRTRLLSRTIWSGRAAMIAVSLTLAGAGSASASVSGYFSNPTGNSTDWGNAVTSLGATINTSVNFNAIPTLGAVDAARGGFYSSSAGVTFSASNIVLGDSVTGNGYGTPYSQGEGIWTPSKLLVASSAALGSTPEQSVTFTFDNAVNGGGIFLVDYFGSQAWTISAMDIDNNVLGSFQSLTGTSFQRINIPGEKVPHKYFLGISSTAADIASLRISRPRTSTGGGDIVGLDDFRFAVAAPAAVPEPETYAMLLAGLGLMGTIARRRKNKSA